MYDNDEYLFFLDEEVDGSSIENFIYQEVVNRKEKERRSRVKADYIKKHGKTNTNDDIKETPKNRKEYEAQHKELEKRKIKGDADIREKDSHGYSRLYGEYGGKRNFLDNSLHSRSSKMTATPERERGVFKGRGMWSAVGSAHKRNDVKNHLERNRIYLQDRENEKTVPHKKTIDAFANSFRNAKTKQTLAVAMPLINSPKTGKTVKTLAQSHPASVKAAAYLQNVNNLGEKVANKFENQQSTAVKAAYTTDRAISKGAKKAKEVAKKFVAKKLKNNRSAKSEEADLFDIDNDWEIDL